MLKMRLITALILGSLMMFAVFDLNTTSVAVILGGFIAIGAWEWAALSDSHLSGRVVFMVTILGLCYLSLRLPLIVLMVIGIVWWVWAGIEVFVLQDRPSVPWRHTWGRWLSGALVLVPAWRGCVALKAQAPAHPWLLVLLFGLVWTADSLAYFTGRAWGRRRLAPKVSPGKSVEGVAGGVSGAAVLASGSLWLAGFGLREVAAGLIFGSIVALFSVVGDLLESKAKRLAGVKDSGRWLPGHGGVLDRIDALVAAVPIFVLGLRWLGGMP